jgi:hypothetical protein
MNSLLIRQLAPEGRFSRRIGGNSIARNLRDSFAKSWRTTCARLRPAAT